MYYSYIMTERTRNKRKNSLICYTCRKELKVGDKIFTKLSSGASIPRHYSCAKKVNLV